MRAGLVVLTSSLLVLVATACGSSAPTPTAVLTPTLAPLSSSALEELGLSETYAFSSMGFSMAHPTGWLTGVSFRTNIISELEEDHSKGFPNTPGIPRPTKGYQVTLTVLSKDVYLKRSARNLDGLLSRWASGYGLKAPDESVQAQMFRGTPALRVTGTMGFNRIVNCLIGQNEEFAYLLCLGAPTEMALAEFTPTWERMLASIKPVGE